MKASDLFLQCLELQGVKTIYGVPGEENADVMISLLDSEIDFITTRHEQTAAFMAEMHGRLTGVPGVCMATLVFPGCLSGMLVKTSEVSSGADLQ